MRCSSAMSTRMSLHPLGHLDAEQLLDRQAERQAVRLRAEVVHPLDERDDLLPLLLLGGLLDAGVQVADGRVGR